MKHPHYEAIIAYANGEQLQYLSTFSNEWRDSAVPSFDPTYKYRVKPKAQKLYYRNYLCKGFDRLLIGIAYGKEECSALNAGSLCFIKWLGEMQEYEIL
jgi:hypothetical protein